MVRRRWTMRKSEEGKKKHCRHEFHSFWPCRCPGLSLPLTRNDPSFIGGLEFGAALLIAPLCTILTRELGRKVVMSGGVVSFLSRLFLRELETMS